MVRNRLRLNAQKEINSIVWSSDMGGGVLRWLEDPAT